jgi:hypothetical protein
MKLVEFVGAALGHCRALFFAGLVICCAGGRYDSDGGSETHFLSRCDGSCGANFECRCGVCTQSCTESAACSALSSTAACVPSTPRSADGRCPSEDARSFCDFSCLADGDCTSLGSGSRCDAGYCRTAESPSSTTNESAALDCTPLNIDANSVAVFGDSLIELSPFVTELEGAAANAGELASGEHYRGYASATLSFLAQNRFSISAQYAMSLEGGAPRVAIMNGGATDMLQYTCGDTPTPDCAAVKAAVSGAEQLLSRMAGGGVEHIVYFFYADARDLPEFKAGIDVLRPLLRNVCGHSAVPCHWVDLRPSFAGHDDYFGPDGIVFSNAGAHAAASAVWDLMVKHCVPR